MSTAPVPEELDDALLCYCTGLTIGEVRLACGRDGGLGPGKELSGKLCTGCLGDLLHCLRRFGAPDRTTSHDSPTDP